MNYIDIRNTICRRLGLQKSESDFVRFFKNYLECYTLKDRRVMKQAFDRYLLFLSGLPPETRKKAPSQDSVQSFADFLEASSKGCGAYSTFSRFKKVVRKAVGTGILPQDPCRGIRISPGANGLTKDILSDDEIRRLLETHPAKENPDIRNAFIVSLYTGLRYCDVRNLKYSDIDFSNKLLTVNQSKTRGRCANSLVHIPLRDDIIQLITASGKDTQLFALPSHPTCLKALRTWTKEAGISKHITWHCARHTFATNILMNGADVRVVADLLGHSSLKYVEIYTRAIDRKKIQAVNSLPPLK